MTTEPAAIPLPLTDDQLRQVAAKYLHDDARDGAGDVMGHLERFDETCVELGIGSDDEPVEVTTDQADAIADRISDLMATADITVEWSEPAGLIDAPVFTIKAKDLLAVPTIRHYQFLCSSYGLHEQAAEVEAAIQEMAAWIKANPSEFKLPDHKHVPAGGAS